MTDDVRYYRLALFADPVSSGSSSARELKEALEALGHTVFWFDPERQPYLLALGGVVRGYMVRQFLRTQKLDGVLFADGLTIDYPLTARGEANAPFGWLCETQEQADRLQGGFFGAGQADYVPDFAVAVGAGATEGVLKSVSDTTRRYDLPDTDAVEGLVEALADDFSWKGAGSPRSIACVFGYIGTDNFANNYILATVDERLRMRVEGSTVVAISMNPQHTLEHLGVYAMSMQDKYALDVTLAYASAILVVAGVLNDQGVRSSMGNGELFSNMDGCSLYAATALATLSHLNGSKMALYGGGAGPLDHVDAKKLVSLMAMLGMEFVARDAETMRVLRAAGLPDGALSLGAEPLMLGRATRTEFVDTWLAERRIDAEDDRILAVTLRSGDGFGEDFPRRVANVLGNALAEDGNLRVVLCALDPGDSRLLETVKAAAGDSDRVNIFHAGANIGAVGDLLSRAYAGFSMQYYGTLVLMRSGVPCMGVACQVKESALFEEVGCEELSLGGGASEVEMSEALRSLLARRDEWAARVSEGLEAVRERACETEERVVAWMREFDEAKAFAVSREPYPFALSANDRRREREMTSLVERLGEVERQRDHAYRAAAKRGWGLFRRESGFD